MMCSPGLAVRDLWKGGPPHFYVHDEYFGDQFKPSATPRHGGGRPQPAQGLRADCRRQTTKRGVPSLVVIVFIVKDQNNNFSHFLIFSLALLFNGR
jgi:hypothetical protein